MNDIYILIFEYNIDNKQDDNNGSMDDLKINENIIKSEEDKNININNELIINTYKNTYKSRNMKQQAENSSRGRPQLLVSASPVFVHVFLFFL